MELILLGINILLLMVVWHYMVKKTLLDNTRDQLFDLRDEIRREYLSRGWGIDNDVYGNLRGLINAYLRHTESYTVWRLVAFHVELGADSKAALREHMNARIESNFKTVDEEQRKYIANVRARASKVLIQNSIYSSGLLLLLAVALTPISMVSVVAEQMHKGVSVLAKAVAHDTSKVARGFGMIWGRSTGWVASHVVDQVSIDAAVSNDKYRFA